MGIISIKNLIHDYVDAESNKMFRAVDDISIDINAGDFIAVIGRNGSGKSSEAITYAQKLMEAGVIVDFRVVGGVWHAFEAAFNPMVMECIGMTNSFIKSVFDE